jgi:hypothetical protein
MGYTPEITPDARVSAQTNLLNGIDSRRGFSVDENIHELLPNKAPFISTLMAFKRKVVNDPDHKYFEHRPAWLDGRTFYSGTSGAPACSATLSGKRFANWTVQKTEDGSDAVDWLVAGANLKYTIQVVDADDASKYCNFLVTTIDSTTQIDVIQLTDSPGFDVADNDKITIIGTAYAEGSEKAYAFSDKVSPKWASCEIEKTLAKASRTTMKMWVAGGNEWERILTETETLHKVDLERKSLLGARSTGNNGGSGETNTPFGSPQADATGGSTDAPIRTSISIQQAARWADSVGMGGSRVFNNTKATYSYSDFIDDTEELFEFDTESYYFFGGRGVLTMLTKMALNKDSGITYSTDNMNDAGVKYTNFVTPHGELKFVKHPLFRGDYANKAFAVDMNLIDLLVFDGTFVETDVKTPGYDGIEHQFVSDMGLQINLPEKSVSEWTWV